MSTDWTKVLRLELECFKFPRMRKKPAASPGDFYVIPDPGMVLREYAKVAEMDKSLCHNAGLILAEAMGGRDRALDLMDEVEEEMSSHYEDFPMPDGGDSDFFFQYVTSQAVALPVYVHGDQTALSPPSRNRMSNFRDISVARMKVFRLGYVPIGAVTNQGREQHIVWWPEFA